MPLPAAQQEMAGGVVKLGIVEVSVGWHHIQHITGLQHLIEHRRTSPFGDLLDGHSWQITQLIHEVVAPETCASRELKTECNALSRSVQETGQGRAGVEGDGHTGGRSPSHTAHLARYRFGKQITLPRAKVLELCHLIDNHEGCLRFNPRGGISSVEGLDARHGEWNAGASE